MQTNDFASYQIALQQAQRQAKLAEALRQQSFQPIESADQGSVLKAPISHLQGLAKMLQAYAANKGEQRSIENMGKAYGMQGNMIAGMFGAPQGGGNQTTTGAPSQEAQNPTQPQVSPEQYAKAITNSAMTGEPSANQPQVTQPQVQTMQPSGQPALKLPPAMNPQQMANISMMMPQLAAGIIPKWNEPDPTTLAAMNAGYNPAQTRDIQQRTLEKNAYVAPPMARPGSVPLDWRTNLPVSTSPQIADAQAEAAAQIERAKTQNTIFPGMTVGGKEGVPVWGGDIPHMGGKPGIAGQQSGMNPSLILNSGFGMSPGTKAASGEMGKSGAGRYNDTVKLASESPMRINVLDNIINLSEEGTKTGPGQEWKNKVLGYAANTPMLGMIMGGQKEDVGKFQELQKFTYQNALRNWQASGGTGTDAQMEAASHANPNDTLFPQALQQIAKWGKASELALQAKANAQDQWLQTNGGDASKQHQFENIWRQNFDPRVYQMKLMNPAELQQFTAKIPQQERQGLLSKYRFAKQNGLVQ